MSSGTFVRRLGPHRAALLAAGGSATALLLVAALLFLADSVLYWLVLGFAPVDFGLVYLLLKRSFEQA
ncbi:hypothetical protein [Haloarchaeobius iranensis]|uniref:Uncharacterized protein n=1 Tax=Haloarchaeobius iranensis TaxID=996166 RepID=A0A1G9Y933_9EURY|nr:hypothetical protein [Haloarchaeobius iranensis]SDN05001.1 hypothetical protein SAMN05192554_11343 [Haloarchaeobius iranensis]